jgi:hypothetical protein
MVVKLAASIPVCLRATLHNNELLANASIARDVRRIVHEFRMGNFLEYQ